MVSLVRNIITHSLDVFLRKHFVRLLCKLTTVHAIDSIFSVGKYFVRMFHAYRICKPNRRTKYFRRKYQMKQRSFRKGTTALLAKPQFPLSYDLSISWQALTFPILSHFFMLIFSIFHSKVTLNCTVSNTV